MDTSPASRSRRRPRPATTSSGIPRTTPADCDANSIDRLDRRLGGYASNVDTALRRARALTDRAEAEAEEELLEPSPSVPAVSHAHHDDDDGEDATAEATARRFLSDRRRRLGLDRIGTSTCAGRTQQMQMQRRLEAVADALLSFPSSSSPSSSASSSASSLAELSRLCSSVYESNAVCLATVEDGLVHGGGGYGHYSGGDGYEYGGYGTYDGTEARRAAIAALEGRHRHQQLAAADAEADDYGADDCDGDDNDNDGDDDAATIISLGSLGTEEEMLTDGIIGVGQPPPPHLEAICEGGGREQQQQQQR